MKIFFQIALPLLFLIGARCAKDYQVHMAVCSHLDAGWVSTYDDYYIGRNTRYGENVQRIYDSTISMLDSNSEWTYGIADISYFARWWNDRGEDVHNRVRNLIKKGQIEFVNGGWVANDEATVYYEDIIENFRLGNRFLQKEFGFTPKIGWQVDSFGTSATHAALLAQTGYEALFFSRLDNQDRKDRKDTQSLEFMWRPQNPRNESIFTHIFSSDYGPITYLRRAQWISMAYGGAMSTGDINEINDFMNREKTYFKTKHLFFPLCGDFYIPALHGMQSLVDGFRNKKDSPFNFKFSTVTQFTKDVLSNVKVSDLPSKYGDFFPYIESDEITWAGYFTSKAMFKRLVRATSQHAQAMKIFAAKALYWRNNNEFGKIADKLHKLQSVSSIFQHHDAITGTMKEFVRHDYYRMAQEAVTELQSTMKATLKTYLYDLFKETVVDEKLELQFINQFINDGGSLSLQSLSDGKIISDDSGKYTIAAFNPGLQRSFLVKVKLPETNGKGITLLTQDNTEIVPDVICLNTKSDIEECWVYFMDTIPDFALKFYKIAVTQENLATITPQALGKNQVFKIYDNNHIKVQDNYNVVEYRHCPTKAKYDNYASDSSDCTNTDLTLQYGYYKSAGGNDQNPSGAYILTFEKGSKLQILPTATGINTFVGKHVTILQFVRKDLDSFLLFGSLNTELPGFEVHTKIYSVPENERGREFILQLIDPTIKNSGSFHVDQNGYYTTERKFGHKDNYTPHNPNEIRQNYFPMTAFTYIGNDKKRLTLVTDRPQGVSSTSQGEIEVMLHRTGFVDDHKGVDEALYEKTPTDKKPINVTTTHYVLFTDSSDSHSFARRLQIQEDRPIQYWIYKAQSAQFTAANVPSKPLLPQASTSTLKFSMFTPDLDSTFLTFQNINDKGIAMKLCDATSFKSPIFNKLCYECDITISAIQETTWNTIETKNTKVKCGDTISFLPMEIRTFKLSIKSNYDLQKITTIQSGIDLGEYIITGPVTEEPKNEEPKTPTKPNEPEQPGKPEEPKEEEPKTPTKPNEPNQPTKPNEPNQPGKPEEPKEEEPKTPTKPNEPGKPNRPDLKPPKDISSSNSRLMIYIFAGVYLVLGFAFLPVLLTESTDLFTKVRGSCSVFAYVIFAALWPALLVYTFVTSKKRVPGEAENIEFQEIESSGYEGDEKNKDDDESGI